MSLRAIRDKRRDDLTRYSQSSTHLMSNVVCHSSSISTPYQIQQYGNLSMQPPKQIPEHSALLPLLNNTA